MTELNIIANKIEQSILKDIRDGSSIFTPKQADEYLLLLAAWYDKYSEEMAKLEISRAEEWIDLRKESKTNTETEMLYDATTNGKRRIELKYQLKALEKLISALKARLQRLNNESYNQY